MNFLKESLKYVFIENKDIGYGALLTPFTSFVISILPWVKKCIKGFAKFINTQLYRFIRFIRFMKSEYFTPISYANFHGNHLRNDSVLEIPDAQKIKVHQKYREPFNTLIYCIQKNQGRNPDNNLNSDEFEKLIEFVWKGLSWFDKCKLNNIYNRYQRELKDYLSYLV